MKIKSITAIFLTLFLQLILSAQENDKWTKVVSAEDNFVISLPPNFLVDKEEKIRRIYAFSKTFTVKIETVENSKAKSEFKKYRSKKPRFVGIDFVGEFSIDKKDKNFLTTIWLASSKANHTITIVSHEETNSTLNRLLNSIRLDNEPLFNGQSLAVENTEESISLVSIKTSQPILEALLQPDAEKKKFKYDLDGKEIYDEDFAKYSRPFVIIRKPRPSYTDAARFNGVQGQVKLNVVFRADGQIDDIIVLQGLSNGLTEEAVKAARKIKFIPAEIDGKAVEVIRTVKYQFTIY